MLCCLFGYFNRIHVIMPFASNVLAVTPSAICTSCFSLIFPTTCPFQPPYEPKDVELKLLSS